MYFSRTIAILVLLTAAIFVLRFFWRRLPGRLRAALLTAAGICVMLQVLMILSRWSLTSNLANTLMYWAAAASYLLILMRFSLVRPRWLTAFCAVVLLLPIFSASVLLPLMEIFYYKDTDYFSIGKPYLCERRPWGGRRMPKNYGFSVSVFYEPRLAPFLKHRLRGSAFNIDQCQATASTAVVYESSDEILFHCPANPRGNAVNHILPLK
ncbi:MAG: hypothetical protein FWD64_07455 [Acidobacteriaceae bacterium]|nr:hypothetical protein [Acidobacteriaceae bacterium]